MTDLAVGANAVMTGTTWRCAVTAPTGTVDLFVVSLGTNRTVRSDTDLVFFGQPRSPEGGIHLVDEATVNLDLTAVPGDVEALLVAIAATDPVTSLGSVDGLGVTATGGGEVYTAPCTRLTTERAAVLAEVYRRGGGWKLRSVCAGWTEGMAALLREHGVTVDDEPPQPVTPEVKATTAEPSTERANTVSGQTLDLRKREVHKVLLTKGASTVAARVVLVLDKTGSMRRQYSTGVVSRVVERMVPVAATLDDDGALECYLYARRFAKLPDVHADTVTQWCEDFVHLSGRHGGFDYDDLGAANDEPPILRELIAGLHRGAVMPTLVLFFTDGGFSQRREIAALITKAAGLPAFFQFVGVGRGNFGLLEQLDDLPGREVDNVGFVAVDDVDAVSDALLYTRLVGEFPEWLRAARQAGIVGSGQASA